MTGAELDTRLVGLGLSVNEAATVIGCTRRMISYWTSDAGAPGWPADVAARLMEVEIAMGDLVDAIVEGVSDEAERATVTLPRFRTIAALEASGLGRGLPLGAHAMAMAWAADDLRGDGHEVSFEWQG